MNVSNKNEIKKILWIFYCYLKHGWLLLLNIMIFIPMSTAIGVSFWQLHFQKPYFMNKTGTQIFTIKKDEPLKTIASNLFKSRIINNERFFTRWLIRFGMDRRIQPGSFLIEKDYTLWQIIKKISNTSDFNDRVTVHEGLNIRETAKLFARAGTDENDFLSLCQDKDFIESLHIDADTLEGYLFPDTYDVFYAEEPEKIIRRMVKRFEEILASLNLNKSDIYNKKGLKPGLIVASIVEKESSHLKDRPKVASVFWNRIKKDWRLDSDCTVRYALNKWSGILTKKDLAFDSPYNTRKYKGLTPGPICSPGKNALKAAFFPEETDLMFFIYSGEDDGSSFFQKRIKDHNKVKTKLKNEGKLKP